MKKNVLQVVIIVLLVILIAMVFGFGVYYIVDNEIDNGVNSNGNNINDSIIDSNDSNVKMELTTEEKNSIISQIKALSEINKFNNFSIDKASESEIVEFMIGKIDLETQKLQDIINRYFYINKEVDGSKINDILCSIDNKPLYKYDSKTDMISIIDGHYHGGDRCNTDIQAVKILDSKIKGDIYTIKANILFTNLLCEMSIVNKLYTIYPNPNVNPFFVIFEEEGDPFSNDYTNMINEGIDKFNNTNISDIYTYTFKKIGDNFKLISLSYNK